MHKLFQNIKFKIDDRKQKHNQLRELERRGRRIPSLSDPEEIQNAWLRMKENKEKVALDHRKEYERQKLRFKFSQMPLSLSDPEEVQESYLKREKEKEKIIDEYVDAKEKLFQLRK
ncbi:MAG: hypothetical protein H0W64_09200 [Gammaproteobacteria bacterium]|nr:hypothetical protein [Gammaproteobacteria bacterium]